MLAEELHHFLRGRVSIGAVMAVAYLQSGAPSLLNSEDCFSPHLIET